MAKKPKIAFIGLGVMGYHMAGFLAKNNHHITVWNRNIQRSIKWHDEFSKPYAESLKEAVTNADVVIICVGKDEDVLEVVLSAKGIIHHMKQGSVLIDHTTTSFNLTKTLHKELSNKNINFIDAPLTGGEAGAKGGILSIMCGGDKDILEKVKPIIYCYSKIITYIGASGSGQLAKMTNQICICGVIQSLSEAIKFAEAENINIDNLLNAISGGAAQSWQMDNRANTMHKRNFDFGFAVKWMVKDLGYCIDRAKKNGTDLEFTKQIYDKYLSLMKTGYENKDTSSLILAESQRNKT